MSTQGEYLQGIADAIREKDGTVEPIQATAFAERIRNLPSQPKPGEPLDPKEVYKATRPADWLPMPVPEDNEIYLLFHIPDGLTAKIAFVVNCTGSYKVEHGTVTDGAFVSKKTAATKASGTVYEEELKAADYTEADYGPLTSDGFRQVMIKVSGDTITKWRNAVGSDKAGTAQHFAMWNIVEIRCKLLSATEVKCYAEWDGDTAHTTTQCGLLALFYFALDGPNMLADTNWMFSNCWRLVCVPDLDMSSATSAERMFYGCYSLTAIPDLDTHACTNMSSIFNSCYSLTAILDLDTHACTNMSYMFASCYSLTAIPDLDTHACTNMSSIFNSCYSLTAIPDLDTHACTNMSYMFASCYSLTAIPDLDTAVCTNMQNMFNSCYSLTAIPDLDTAVCTNMQNMFYCCYSLTAIPDLDTAVCTNMQSMFNSCYSLKEKLNLDISAVTSSNSLRYTFQNCYNLERVTLAPMGSWPADKQQDLYFENLSLSREALIELFNSLPIVTGKILYIKQNPGNASLTSTDKANATAKGWKLDGDTVSADPGVTDGPGIEENYSVQVGLDREDVPALMDVANEYGWSVKEA